MLSEQHILISLDRRHAENIFSGKKLVELRRRSMNISPGTTVWIYVKLPVGSVVGKARVSAFHRLAPSTLWRRFSSVSCLARQEFFDYFQGVSRGFALALEGVERLESAVSLEELRNASSGFQPPQFFRRIGSGDSLLSALKQQEHLYLQTASMASVV